jgi:hypothetical protein
MLAAPLPEPDDDGLQRSVLEVLLSEISLGPTSPKVHLKFQVLMNHECEM